VGAPATLAALRSTRLRNALGPTGEGVLASLWLSYPMRSLTVRITFGLDQHLGAVCRLSCFPMPTTPPSKGRGQVTAQHERNQRSPPRSTWWSCAPRGQSRHALARAGSKSSSQNVTQSGGAALQLFRGCPSPWRALPRPRSVEVDRLLRAGPTVCGAEPPHRCRTLSLATRPLLSRDYADSLADPATETGAAGWRTPACSSSGSTSSPKCSSSSK
jgi:hypothetical protein